MSLLSVSGVCRSGLRRNALHPNSLFEALLHRLADVPLAIAAGAFGLLGLGASLPMQALIPSPPPRRA